MGSAVSNGAARVDTLEDAGSLKREALPIRPQDPAARRFGFAMKERAREGSDAILMAVAICATLLFAGGSIFPNAYDNDVWFFLATGEWIAQHGIPYTNPFSIHEGLGFVAQQWLHCLISYLLYSAGGFVAMGIWTTMLFLALAASMYVLGCKLRRTRSGSEVVMILVAICIVAASAYATVRPHLYSMLAFVWMVWACESYRASGNGRYLIACPLIACVHVNLHAAIAPYDLFIIACYALPDVLAPFHARGKLQKVSFVNATYARLPLLAALVTSAVALLINPYGIKGALYLFLSFGAAGYRDRINEMRHFTPAADWQNALNTALMLVAVLVAGRMGAKRIDAPLSILCAAGIVGTLAYLRNQWICALFCFMYLAWGTRRAWFGALKESRAVKGAACAIVGAGVVGTIALMVAFAPALEEQPEDSPSTPVKTVDYLDSIGVDKETTRVFTFFNAGGFLEYHGFKVNIDPRPEIWNSGINGVGYDYYFEYVEMAAGDMAFNLYNARYDFDVFFIDSDAGTDPYFEDDPDYVEIQGGAGYRAYAKRSWIEQYA